MPEPNAPPRFSYFNPDIAASNQPAPEQDEHDCDCWPWWLLLIAAAAGGGVGYYAGKRKTKSDELTPFDEP